MRVQLIDVDSKISNLALMKISTYHKTKGDIVGFHTQNPDLVYISTIFTKNRTQIPSFPKSTKIIRGGSGYSLDIRLPNEIEFLKPDYMLYPEMDYSLGFSTRGCMRNCPFCIVPRKEGSFILWQHPEKWYNPAFKKIVFLDNNILWNPIGFKKATDWCNENDLKVWFSQGFDIRLVGKWELNTIHSMKHFKTISFAFDWDRLESLIRKKVALMERMGFNLKHEIQFFVYVDSNDCFDSALHRCNVLRELGTNAFVMFNINHKRNARIRRLQRWANRRWGYWKVPFEEFECEKQSPTQTHLIL